VIIATFVVLGAMMAYAQTDSTETAKRLFYLSGEEEISSGGYLFGTDSQKMGTLYFPFVYDITSESDFTPYITVSAGYAAARYGSPKKWMKLYGLKLGGGLKYSTKDTYDIRIGGAYQLSHFDNTSGVSARGYEFDATYTYHPYFGQWEPYLQAAIRYKHASIKANGITNNNSIAGRLKAGIITPTFAHPFGLPMRMEIYGEGMMLHGDIQKTFGSKYLGIAGVKAYITSPILQSWISELTFGAQYVKGENLSGISIGVGVKF
jgi:hypothetical protein